MVESPLVNFLARKRKTLHPALCGIVNGGHLVCRNCGLAACERAFRRAIVAIEDSSLLKDLFQQKDIVENKNRTCATFEID